MKVGLFFGSFNPIHTGHLIVAHVIWQQAGLDEVWFVVSPQNPFKKNQNLLHEFDRLDLVQAAIADDYHFRVSDVEFHLTRPSYTVDTLAVLADKFPQHQFQLIIGEDNLAAFPKWKNHEAILAHFGLLVYPRPHAQPSALLQHPKVQLIQAPQMDISATLIRDMIRARKSVKYLVPDRVAEVIRAKKLFL